MSLLFILIIILLVSTVFGWAAKKVHLSEVIGLIVAGLVLSPFFIKSNILAVHQELFSSLAHLGLFTLMFLAGFEVSWNMLVKERKDAVAVTLFTMITSLFLGTFVFLILGFSLKAALIMGVCFGITAESTKARILIQLKKLKTKIGSLLMGTGIINDLVGVVLFTLIVYILDKNFSWTEIKILGGVLIAFFGGILTHYLFDRYSEKIKAIEKWLLYLIVPFLFVNIGLNFDLGVIKSDYTLLLIVIFTATVGQIAGAFFAKPVTKLNDKQTWLVGWGMNSKGAVELAIVFVALEAGLLPVNLYSALVVATLVSTLLFQIIIFKMVRDDPGIMD